MGDQQTPNQPHVVQMGTLYVRNKPYKIYEGLNVIGRNIAAAVNIKDVNISKNHAMIAVINANQHFIADFNSSNGTKLTTNQLIPLKLYPLDDNVSVQFAEISALYRIDCQENDTHTSSDNTQTSQLIQDLYQKSTQLLVQKSGKHVCFKNEKDFDSTTTNPDDPSDYLDTSNFHDATTQVLPNQSFPEEIAFSKFEDNFHEAKTQVLELPVPLSLRHKITDVSSEDANSSSSKSAASKHEEQAADQICPPENSDTSSNRKDSKNDSTVESDSDESMIFEIRPEETVYYASIMKRKKLNVLKSDDEDDAEPDKENAPSSSFDDIQTPVFIQQKNARKLDSDSETYYDGSNQSTAGGCEGDDNDTNIIPATQEELSEIFNYKPLSPKPSSPKPGPSNNHTFESSEDSFRLGLTQLMNKADLSETCNSNKNSTLKNATLNDSTNADQSFTGNLAGPREENRKSNENYADIGDGNNSEMETQNVTNINDMKDDGQVVNTKCKDDDIYAQPTQKVTSLRDSSISDKIVVSPNKEAQIIEDDDANKLPDTSADTEADTYVENSQYLNEKQHDNIYILPTQKLVISSKRSEILEGNIDEVQIPSKTPTNGDNGNKLGSPSADTESDFIIENTECMDREQPVDPDDIYAQPTQKFHTSYINVSSKNSFEASRCNNENKKVSKTQEDNENKLNSIFNAETEMMPENKPTSKSISGNTKDIVIPVCKKSPRLEQNAYNPIYSMETQVITYPKPLDGPSNKEDDAAINVETQMEVSFSQPNLESAHVLEKRPANPLVAVLKSDTQEEGACVENCDKIEVRGNDQPADEVTKDVSEAANDCSDLKKPTPNLENGKIKSIESVNCTPMQIAPKCDDRINVTKEDSKIKSKAKKIKSQATSNRSDIEQIKTNTVTPRKTRHASLLSNSESGKKAAVTTNNMIIETLDPPKSNNDVKEKVKLPKKRAILNSNPEENVEDNPNEGSIMLKRSKRKILDNIDEVEQEPVAVTPKPAAEETSQLVRKKSTRSSRSSHCDKLQLTTKPTKRNSRITISSLKANQSDHESSSDEFEKPPEANTNSTRKQDKIGSKCNSRSSTKEEKVMKSKTNSRTRKTLDVLNENQDKSHEAKGTSDCDKKQKPPHEKLVTTSRTSSPASTSSGVSLPNAKSPTRSSKPLDKDTTNPPEIQATRRKRKQEVSKTEASSTSSTSIVENTGILEVKTPIRKGRSNTGSSSTNSPLPADNRLQTIQEAHLPSKKRRRNVADIGNSSASSSENVRSSSASSNTMNTPERKKRTLKPKVVFTMMDNPMLESTIRHLGGSVVDSVAACTVLVTEKVKRTMKLLTAIGFGKPICSPKWIQESKKTRQFLDPWDFILKDPEAEGKWGFSLSDSLQKSTNTKLLDGLNFHILATDNIADVLKSAIEACGGKCLHRITKADASKNIFIVTPEECKSKCLKLKKQHKNTTAIDPEGIFESVLKQELRLVNHLVDV